jgi:multidrug efflux pump
MERLAAQLPEGFAFDWTGVSYEEKQSAGQIGLLLGLSLVVVFLLLSAVYESWAVPLAVLLVVPLGRARLGGVHDVPGDVGRRVLQRRADHDHRPGGEERDTDRGVRDRGGGQGQEHPRGDVERGPAAAAPDLMTSLAFILGMVPLVIATGAGAASRRAVGTGAAGGMLNATLLGVFFIPLFYMSVRRWISRRRPPAPGEHPHSDAEPLHA